MSHEERTADTFSSVVAPGNAIRKTNFRMWPTFTLPCVPLPRRYVGYSCSGAYTKPNTPETVKHYLT